MNNKKQKFSISNIILKMIGFLAILLSICTIVNTAQSNTSDTYEGARFYFTLTNRTDDVSKTIFSLSEKIVIDAFLENNSTELFPFPISDEFYQYRFDLTKVEGKKTIAYRSDKATVLSIREEEPGPGRRLKLDPIFPGFTQKLTSLKLYDRYENLVPGTYQLNIQCKTGKSIELGQERKELRLSHEITFEIVP